MDDAMGDVFIFLIFHYYEKKKSLFSPYIRKKIEGIKIKAQKSNKSKKKERT